jgi:hypothetical protein
MKSEKLLTEALKGKMMILYAGMILAGVAAAAWGLPAAHRLQGIKAAVAAVTVLAGVILVLLGTLLLAVPGFFEG